ncbi:MAG: hypothetical protein K2Q22_09130, partial [Cytophagales bacterium]|nr:hypothetical protein [Cytophagales bacterium]
YIKAHPNLKSEMAARQQRINELLKTDSSILKSPEKKDSLQKQSHILDSISLAYEKRMVQAIGKSDSLINTDIAKVNQLIGLGWIDRCKDKTTKCSCFCWIPTPRNFNGTTILGWIISAIAISMGAPFWFDLLNKLFKLRGNSNADVKNDKENNLASNQNSTPINRKG